MDHVYPPQAELDGGQRELSSRYRYDDIDSIQSIILYFWSLQIQVCVGCGNLLKSDRNIRFHIRI